jgi:cap1 methyltransferase
MLEMITEFQLDQPSAISTAKTMRTFHLAEGPGGFIEAICNKRANPADEYIGMTIVYDRMDDNVPAWHKTGHFLSRNPNVSLEYGCDGTGDLLHMENFEYCVRKYGSSMDLITADGGFDFSKDFNHQEITITNLLWGQVCYAICLQKRGGNFVLKVFDMFYEHTVHILYILSGFYETVHLCKLKTSRIGNSEKYIVCKGFRFSMYYEYFSIIRVSFSKISRAKDVYLTPSYGLPNLDIFAKDRMEMHIWKLVNFEIPRHFTKQIEDINAVFGKQQIENIHFTLSLIDKHPKQERIDQIVKKNITKCINWCIEYSIPYNNFSTNIFDYTNGKDPERFAEPLL